MARGGIVYQGADPRAYSVADPGVAGQVMTSNGPGADPSMQNAPGLTTEQTQDAIGTILVDSATIDFTYDDPTPSITAVVKDSSIGEGKQVLADVTTHDVNTTKHGYAPKAPNDITQFLSGDGTWRVPSGGSGGGGHLHGLMRILGDGSTTTFNLLDIAEYLEHVGVNGSFLDPLTFALSADGSQIVFDSAPGAGQVIAIEYVIAGI